MTSPRRSDAGDADDLGDLFYDPPPPPEGPPPPRIQPRSKEAPPPLIQPRSKPSPPPMIQPRSKEADSDAGHPPRPARRAGTGTGGGNQDPGLIATLACFVTGDASFARDAGSRLYRFVNGVYRPDGPAFVKQRVKGLLGQIQKLPSWSSHLANEVVEYIRVDAPELWERPPQDRINVLNGLVDLATGEQRLSVSRRRSSWTLVGAATSSISSSGTGRSASVQNGFRAGWTSTHIQQRGRICSHVSV